MLGIIENIEISKIKCSIKPLRKDVGDITQLTWSIAQKGMLHPIIVKTVENHFEIVAGNRRFLSCKKIGWRKIPCHIIDVPERESFEIALIENIQRKTINPIEEAYAYDLYVKESL